MMILGSTRNRAYATFICILMSAVSLIAMPCSAQFSSQSKGSSATKSPDLVYVINLHGTVGKIPGDNDTVYTADSLKASLDAAAKAKATVVVLDIEGPGGLVTQMRYMVKVLLDAQVKGMRIVALPRDAFSAWSIVSLACKEIVVTPTTRMGAAVTIKRRGDGFVESPEEKDAVSQKFAAPWNALCRQVTDLTKRSPAIADAMQMQQSELWWSPTKGFSATKGPENDWQQMDDEVTVLCLTGAEMLKTKLALGEVKSIDEIPALLHCTPSTQILLNKEFSTRSKSVTVPIGTKSEDDKCRKACARIREAYDLSGDWRKKSYQTESQLADAIQSCLINVQRRLPNLEATDCDPQFILDLAEIRTLLKEASNAARGQACEASQERIAKARSIMHRLANTY
jgi:hypothetical protein